MRKVTLAYKLQGKFCSIPIRQRKKKQYEERNLEISCLQVLPVTSRLTIAKLGTIQLYPANAFYTKIHLTFTYSHLG